MYNPEEITVMLHGWKSGDSKAINELVGVVYNQLKHMAHRYTNKDHGHYTMNTTGLVHEAYIQLMGQHNKDFNNRAHFYAIMSTCMRRVLLENIRNRQAIKRGGDRAQVDLDESMLQGEKDLDQILSVDQALNKLIEFDPDLAKLVEYRYFGGMTLEEIAEVSNKSLSTVKREWRLAKSWLYSELKN